MIRSSDYWATLLGLALIGSIAYSIRRANRQIQRDRERTVHAATVRALGDGNRVVLSMECAGGFPYRLTVGENHVVYGFTQRERAFGFVGFLIANADQLDRLDVDKFAIENGAVVLSHPALRLRTPKQLANVTDTQHRVTTKERNDD